MVFFHISRQCDRKFSDETSQRGHAYGDESVHGPDSESNGPDWIFFLHPKAEDAEIPGFCRGDGGGESVLVSHGTIVQLFDLSVLSAVFHSAVSGADGGEEGLPFSGGGFSGRKCAGAFFQSP